MTKPRRICVITGSRADYGLQSRLIQLLADDPRTEPRLIVTGSHLVADFGLTVGEIEADGVAIAERVECVQADDSGLGMAKSLGLAVIGLAEALGRQKPDLVVVFGDRYEMLAAASAAMALRLPLAHIAGGQLTEGAVDDAIRHAITKLAHLHFTAIEPYRRRILQLGEAPERVFTVGSTGLDAIRLRPRLGRAEVEARLGMTLGERSLMVTFHPETLSPLPPEAQITEMLSALGGLDDDVRLIFTMANADAGGRAITRAVEEFVARRPGRSVLVASLGQQGYLSALAQVQGVVGNSSSGLIEVPSFGIGTVNIGDRQKGRLRAASIIDCPILAESIADALTRLLSPEFQAMARSVVNPFGDGHASERILDVLAAHPLDGLIRKGFVDLP
ncbi:UDP-N-acetylglucosamine 2-epimerase [Paramagnetospirillum magnetotacticum MS-1]|uniref:UDP-N-acetylglucosamine 2-epimerase n=1 Tax=Paramagnetospirillum magnetotacticum MS-1 TaxID=272627 RepID=A0A0C2YRK4_PARME|nr:UDP-N-acetylglucosamine 2-epimerase [Paramagnetospirillum magnetotacticum]KIL97763.1 UDP-N-acetylglucosamine 2-epimerase [Paramagnetospirillum magnetotacticum MS-1]